MQVPASRVGRLERRHLAEVRHFAQNHGPMTVRQWRISGAMCAVAISAVLVSLGLSSGQSGVGNALAYQPGESRYSGQSLANAPDDFGIGLFQNATTSPVIVTGVTLSSSDHVFSKYRLWVVNYCNPDTGLLIQFNGDPREEVDIGEIPPPKVFAFHDVTVPPIGMRASVPASYGHPNCLTPTGLTPLYYIDEVVPTAPGEQTVTGYVVYYRWRGARYHQFEPLSLRIHVYAHRYWKGPPSLSQLWGRGLSNPG